MLDIVTTGRPDLLEIAREVGFLIGGRVDRLPNIDNQGLNVQFIDMSWKDPSPELLVEKAKKHTPRYVVAGDYDGTNIPEINERADELQNHADNVIVVPKNEGEIEHVPEDALIGYSTPTEYGSTSIPREEYKRAEQQLHILGGSPQQQRAILDYFQERVQSVDGCSIHRGATMFCKYLRGYESPGKAWRQITEDEISGAQERTIEAYRRSVSTYFQLITEHRQSGLHEFATP